MDWARKIKLVVWKPNFYLFFELILEMVSWKEDGWEKNELRGYNRRSYESSINSYERVSLTHFWSRLGYKILLNGNSDIGSLVRGYVQSSNN